MSTDNHRKQAEAFFKDITHPPTFEASFAGTLSPADIDRLRCALGMPMRHLTLESEIDRLSAEGYQFMAQHPMHEPCKTMQKETSYGLSAVMLHTRDGCPHDLVNETDGSISISVKPAIRAMYQ